jgi:alpha-L-fucosidase
MKNVISVVIVASFILGLAPLAEAAEKPKSNRVEWFTEARFGMFVTWGLYSILEGSWNGHTLPDPSLPKGESWYADWVQMRLDVPREDYRALTKKFNPVKFNADEWISEAKRSGMRYFVITAKFHDGFALWDSAVSDYDLSLTPYKGDLLGDLAKACKKHSIKLGFYYSHWQDWGHPGGAVPFWKGDLKPSQEEFEKYWQGISLPQVKELLDRYDPDLLWFDTWSNAARGYITPERRDELIALVRKTSPKCLINGRICYHNPGNDIDYLETGDNKHPKKNLGMPWQTPATMNHSWGWHANDFSWKSSKAMIKLLAQNSSLGGNYLLNVGPKSDGTFPRPAIKRLREMGGWIAANGEAIYGMTPVSATPVKGIRHTRRVLPDNTPALLTYRRTVKERCRSTAY